LKVCGYYPHTGQVPILRALESGVVKDLFLQCSRNFGKSTTVGFDMVGHAGLNPKSKNYIIAPYRVQAKEIYYDSGFLHAIIPPGWLMPGDEGFNKTELRWKFKNGSYIKLDGADNEQALRGYKPSRLACDEFQDWKKTAWQGMEPNLLAYDATVLKVGTPPDRENLYTEQAEFIKQKMREENPRYLWIRRTIYDNPRIPVERIEELKAGFIKRGEDAVWRREYLAEFIPGGAASVYPMFSTEDHVRPRGWIDNHLRRDHRPIQFYTVFDPSGTRFAVGFFAYNRHTSEMFLLGEIVETDRSKLSAGQLWLRVQRMEAALFGRSEPVRIYDEQASLFGVEMANLGCALGPTSKRQNQKSNNISLVRDALVSRRFVICDECEHTIKEFFNYHYDDNGRIVKKEDDMMDTILYFVAESGYSFNSEPVNLEPESPESRIPAQEMRHSRDDRDWEPHHENELDEDYLETNLWN
jgi:hypothetical protein